MIRDLCIPPGETILDLMNDRGITKQDIAVRLGFSIIKLDDILNGKEKLTHDISLKLEEVFGVSSTFWDNLENKYQIDINKCKTCNYLKDKNEI